MSSMGRSVATLTLDELLDFRDQALCLLAALNIQVEQLGRIVLNMADLDRLLRSNDQRTTLALILPQVHALDVVTIVACLDGLEQIGVIAIARTCGRHKLVGPLFVRAVLREHDNRAIVIVTQDRSYEKKPYEFMPAARARYADYPYLLEAIETRHDRYNIQRMHLWKYEREGRALVVAPQKPVEVGHVEHDPAKLLDLYIQGRQEAKRMLADIEAFVER